MNLPSNPINHSMLALILRFIGRNQEVSYCNQEFVRKQLNIIQEHIKQFPPEEREYQAVTWIEKYAKIYREEWERELVSKEFSNQRCNDCPLSEPHNYKHCQIHDQWLELLQQYIGGKSDSKSYVESTLELLSKYKSTLKIQM